MSEVIVNQKPETELRTADFFYDLPAELIAQHPMEQRDTSRLMTLDKTTGEVGHRHFYDLPSFLRPGDCLVLNNSRVLPARLIGHRPTGGVCEVLLLAIRSLESISPDYIFEISHVGLLEAVLADLALEETVQKQVLSCINRKNADELWESMA